MARKLTAVDRTPQVGDVMKCGPVVVTVSALAPENKARWMGQQILFCYTRMIKGKPHQMQAIDNGPWEYVSRADGGPTAKQAEES